jgi:hypothetical protein
VTDLEAVFNLINPTRAYGYSSPQFGFQPDASQVLEINADNFESGSHHASTPWTPRLLERKFVCIGQRFAEQIKALIDGILD